MKIKLPILRLGCVNTKYENIKYIEDNVIPR